MNGQKPSTDDECFERSHICHWHKMLRLCPSYLWTTNQDWDRQPWPLTEIIGAGSVSFYSPCGRPLRKTKVCRVFVIINLKCQEIFNSWNWFNPSIFVLDLCNAVRCPYYASCKDLERGFKCQCPVTCPKIRLAVCGTNGNTYENECELQKQSCWERKWIYVKSLGSCSKFVLYLIACSK